MAEKKREESIIEEAAKDNELFRLWTQTWGLIVRPAYDIDKLKFSFIEKGTEGKGKSFDIYVECLKFGASCFDDWAYDILNDRRLEKILAKEKQEGQKYPVYYKYVTGENGEKSVGIANSTKGDGYCINACGGDKTYANVPVSFHDLRKMAEAYKRSYRKRVAYLDQLREEAEEEANRQRMKYSKKETDSRSNGPAPAASKEETRSAEKSSTEASKPESPKAEQAPAPEKKPVVQVDFKAKGKLEKKNKRYEIPAVTEDGEEVLVRFMFEQVSKTDPTYWEPFEKKFGSGTGNRFSIKGIFDGQKFYFKSF